MQTATSYTKLADSVLKNAKTAAAARAMLPRLQQISKKLQPQTPHADWNGVNPTPANPKLKGGLTRSFNPKNYDIGTKYQPGQTPDVEFIQVGAPMLPVKGPIVLVGPGEAFNGLVEQTLHTIEHNPLPGYHDVVVHGSPDYVLIKGPNGQVTALNPQGLTQFLESSGIPRGSNIRLTSCWTGALNDGFAQQFSRLWGGKVAAPTTPVNGLQNPTQPGGYWKVFSPDQ